jgi:hypothetical protein
LCPELVSLNRFPLVSPLSSTLSAHCSAPQHLFEGFTGTIGLSDFPQPFIVAVLLRFTTRTSHCHMLRPVHGISRFSCIECPRMLRVSDSARPVSVSLYNDIHRVAFPIVQQSQHLGEVISELNTWPTLPLLTLRHAITGHRRIARGPDIVGIRYSFHVGLFHPLLYAGLSRRFLDVPLQRFTELYVLLFTLTLCVE